MTNELYIYKKEIDWSTLHLGINIPISLQNIFYQNLKIRLQKGENKSIKLIIDGVEYQAVLTNINFDEKKYPEHKELLQIRYTPKSDIAKKLRMIFSNSYEYLVVEKQKLENKKKQLSVPIKEYIAIYSTAIENVFAIDCITNNEINDAKNVLSNKNELEVENLMHFIDNSSSIITKEKMVKIRKLDKAISDNLKLIYNFRCQICGEFIGEMYGATMIHSHHIEYFSISLNNNANNIMIICPNHHSIIHATNPVFDRKDKIYIYPNGYREGLQLNMHL